MKKILLSVVIVLIALGSFLIIRDFNRFNNDDTTIVIDSMMLDSIKTINTCTDSLCTDCLNGYGC